MVYFNLSNHLQQREGGGGEAGITYIAWLCMIDCCANDRLYAGAENNSRMFSWKSKGNDLHVNSKIIL